MKGDTSYMKEAINLLYKRRSIRKFTPQTVTEEQIETLLRAVMAAPMSNHKYLSELIVVTDRAMLDQLAETHRYTKMLKEATLCMIVCGEKANRAWEQDCAAATQNILLAATGLGLGSVWLGIHPNPDSVATVRGLLDIPDTYSPLCLIAIGYPAEYKDPSDRFDLARVHRGRW